MHQTSTVLSIDRVSRSFGRGDRRRTVVNGLSLRVHEGEIVCLLGPNGAGKTTTVKMASTLLVPDDGTVTVCGVDAVARPAQARRHLSLVLGGERGFYLRASAIDNLRFFAQIAAVPHHEQERRIADALEQVSLTDRRDARVETFSRGMRQRLHIARAVVGSSRLLLLDEPTTGLDVESALRIRRIVAGLRQQGKGVLLTTHAMPEAEFLADRVVVISSGTAVASGTVRELAGRVRIDGVSSYTVPQDWREDDADRVRWPGCARNVETGVHNGVCMIDVAWCDGEPAGRDLPDGLRRSGSREATLEDVYLALLRSSRRDGAGDGRGVADGGR